MNELTQRGINALKANDRASARKLLAAALQQDQNDATAWLWLAAAVDTPGQRADCLRQVLKIDPTNQAALKGMAALGIPAGEPVEPVQPAEETAPAQQAHPYNADSQDEQLLPEATADELLARAIPAPQPAVVQQPGSSTAQQPGDIAVQQPHAVAAPVAGYRPAHRAETAEEDARKIFKARPSNVPALLAFWVFFFGALFVGSQVNALNPGGTFQGEGPLNGMPFTLFGMLFALGLGVLLELVVLYVVIRNMRTHYELTSASLTVPFRGHRTRIPAHEIYSAECQQTFFQRLYGAGDVLVDAAVKGELAHVRLRSVPECQKRAQEIAGLIQNPAVSSSGR